MQGSVLSPVLYSVYINPLAELLESTATLELHGKKVGGLFYNDEIAIVAKDITAMRRALAICGRHSLDNGVEFAQAFHFCVLNTNCVGQVRRFAGLQIKLVGLSCS